VFAGVELVGNAMSMIAKTPSSSASEVRLPPRSPKLSIKKQGSGFHTASGILPIQRMYEPAKLNAGLIACQVLIVPGCACFHLSASRIATGSCAAVRRYLGGSGVSAHQKMLYDRSLSFFTESQALLRNFLTLFWYPLLERKLT
jgi:hypothetical protein